jgi:hypothetical protein
MEETKEAVRWNIKVSKETDLTLRTYLGALGMKKGDLSKFIEEALRWRIFNRTVQEIKARNANADPDELQAIIDSSPRSLRSTQQEKERLTKPAFRSTGLRNNSDFHELTRLDRTQCRQCLWHVRSYIFYIAGNRPDN